MAISRVPSWAGGDPIRSIGADGRVDPAHDPRLDREALRKIYRFMLLARVLDDRLIRLQRQGRIGFHIGSLGEEASIIGAAAGLRDTDWLWPCYREFGAALYRGMPLQAYVDNMFGNSGDPVKGRQMPDHWTGRPWNVGSVSSPVGTQIPQAAGMAWAAKLSGDDRVVLVFFGEGATSEGDFHVGMNFAGVYKAPCIFFCRNNEWSISVPRARQTASETFAQKAVAYGVHGVQVDGNDPLAVAWTVQDAVERGRRGEGPTLIEALTYRLGAHSTSDDPRGYRKEAEVEPWKAKDPLPRFRSFLEARGDWSLAEEEAAVADTDRGLKDAIAVAEKTPPPEIESLFEEVYARPTWNLVEQLEEARQARIDRLHLREGK